MSIHTRDTKFLQSIPVREVLRRRDDPWLAREVGRRWIDFGLGDVDNQVVIITVSQTCIYGPWKRDCESSERRKVC
jgi:hypothetical protein